MADDDQQQADYSDEELASFGTWVELGARDPALQWILDFSPRTQWERTEPSGSEWVIDLLKAPIAVLMRERIPGLHPNSRITTTINHHERGLNKKIIRIAVTVEDSTGDATMVIDKQSSTS